MNRSAKREIVGEYHDGKCVDLITLCRCILARDKKQANRHLSSMAYINTDATYYLPVHAHNVNTYELCNSF